jgi:hypothetical protein
MKRYLIFLLAILALLSLLGCERLLIKPDAPGDPVSIFEEAWTFADQEYSFFEYKNIDWDAAYQEFRPKVNEDMGDEALFEVIAEMLFLLRDGHVNLRSPFDRSRNWEWFLGSPENFNYSLLERNYFQSEQQFVGPFVVMDFGDVGYLHYSSFGSGVSSRDMQYITDKFRDHKGLIIDVRNNGGGSLGNVYRLAGWFTEEEVVTGQERYKNGPGHDDFSDLEDLILAPQGTYYDKPVVLLTNRRSYSATNFFTLFMRGLPQVTVLGDTTGGGGGAPTFTELANGWNLRVSATQLFTPEGFNVEGGIPPDVQLDLDPADEANGVDTILEEALRRLRE